MTAHTTSSPAQTSLLAQELAKNIKPGSVLALSGPLGSGKTTFTQSLGRALGLVNPIKSPTFTIIRRYPLEPGYFYHLDLYRLESKSELESLGLEEIFSDAQSIAVIEWPQLLIDNLPPHTIHLSFTTNPDSTHTITINQ